MGRQLRKRNKIHKRKSNTRNERDDKMPKVKCETTPTKSAKPRTKCEVFTRCVGYLRPIENMSDSKQQEIKDRVNFDTSVKNINNKTEEI